MTRGFICGAFDLLHPGHLDAFAQAKKHCDELIVGLQVNPHTDRKTKNQPIESVFERWVRLKACKFVDSIIPYETEEDLLNMLKILDLDVRFLDEKYIDKPEKITGKSIVPIYYLRRTHTYSSAGLRERIQGKK